MGLFHQPDDLGEDRLLSHLGGLEIKRAIGVDGRPEYFLAGDFLHGHALAGEHGLVHRRIAACHEAVNRDLISRTHEYHVADGDLVHWDVRFFAVAHDPRQGGPKTDEPSDGFRGAAARSGLQEPTQQDQGNDDGRSVEIDLSLDAVVGQHTRGELVQQHHSSAVHIGDGGAHGDEGVHVGSAVPEGAESGIVEIGAGPELHRRRQGPQQEGIVALVHEPGNPGQGVERSQKQQSRAGASKEQPVAQLTDLFHLGEPFQFPFLVARIVEAVYPVSGAFDSCLEVGKLDHARQELHRRPFDAQVHVGLGHSGHFTKGVFDVAHAGGTSHATNVQRGELGAELIAGTGNGSLYLVNRYLG